MVSRNGRPSGVYSMIPPLSSSKCRKYLQGIVDEMRARFNIPALSVAILFNNEAYSAASGILSINTGVKATTDSIFQIASISKLFTASLIMQLVDEGKLELDVPVKQYLRDFTLADSGAADQLTVAQLLDHTSGIPGDFVGINSYTEQNSLERYLDRCSALKLVHPLGKKYSYSNAAYNIAGRLIEVILGTTWFDAIEERIFKPLGMREAVAHPSQVIKHRVAVGHIPDGDNKSNWVLPDDVYLPICWAPCGSVLTVSASDLIIFAKAHLDKGKAKSGSVWLSHESTALMQEARVKLPPYSPWYSTHCGLGWQLRQGNHPIITGHYGVGPGQRSMLQLVPEHNFAIAALHNSSHSGVIPALLNDVIYNLLGIQLRTAIKGKRRTPPSDFQNLSGIYETILSRILVTIDKAKLFITLTPQLDQPDKTESHYLEQVDNFIFVHESQDGEFGLSFIDVENRGKAKYIYYRGRLIPRAHDC